MKKTLTIIWFIALACVVNARTLYVSYTTADDSEHRIEVTDRNGKFVLDLDNLKTIRFNFTDLGAIDEEVYFNLYGQPDNLGRKLKPYRMSYAENLGLTSLPGVGRYHIEIASDMSYGIFMTAVSNQLYDDTPCYEGPTSGSAKTVERLFTKVSDTEYELDCDGDNAIPALKEFFVRIKGGEYGTARLTDTDDESYWEYGRRAMLDGDFSGKIRLSRIPGNPWVVRVSLEP